MKLSTSALLLVLAGAAAFPGLAAETNAAKPRLPAPNSLVYSHAEMFNFDVESYLLATAPELAQYAESISHWAGYSSISPRVLLTLIEQQSGLLSRSAASKRGGGAAVARPMGALSKQQGFNAQVRDVADQLARRVYEPAPAAGAAEFGAEAAKPTPLRALLASSDGAEEEFAATYQRLFGLSFDTGAARALQDQTAATDDAAEATTNSANAASLLAGPPVGFLQFPFPLGDSWHVGGAHTNTGSGNYPMSSLDMSKGGGWGSNQTGVRVSASAAGTFKRHSSCFAEVVHSGGWSTTYYHLDRLQYNTGAAVAKNAFIGNPANNRAQALCNGGSSTGPHQHWSLKLNGAWQHLNTVNLAGWQITATGSSYDTNCNRFYLTKNGVKRCSGYFSQ
ncbi:M23 family metallopeptidase [Roseateles sp. DAIF2]|uniref:M23 family metallopeptidase n=1 Tax=Roseateles sp. DAIF2 TaxID=2714952 RepID=UPI0018A2B1F6|nr:M23 family metallopeptidase [Roseateles sp. DAIF2]QPF76202.1 M23 family metallopeptidase [Roseateles sp. DAIF2]